MVKLNERANTLQSQQQQQQKPPPQRPSSQRRLPPNMPPRPSPLPTWSNSDFQESDLPLTSLPSAMPDRPRLKDYLATMKPDTWGTSTGRSAKRSSMRREENMYIPPPMSNISDNNHLHTNIDPVMGPLYSSAPSAAGPMRTSLPTFSPHHYPPQSPTHFEQQSSMLPQHQLSYPQQIHSPLHSNDPTASVRTQSRHNQPQMIYNSPNSQPFTQHQQYPSSQSTYQSNLPTQQTFHQPTFQQPSPNQHLGYQPSPPPQQVYQPPAAQQAVYQPQAMQQPIYQPPPPSQPVYQPPPPPPQQQVYQPHPPSQPVYQPPPPPPQQPAYQPPPPSQPVYQPPPPHQVIYQPPAAAPQQPIYQQPPTQHPMYQAPSAPQSIHHPSFTQQPGPPMSMNQHYTVQPTHMNPSPNLNDTSRPTQQPPQPPPKFDPYRPQPVGAYDIPKTQNPSGTPSIPAPMPPVQQQQTVATQPRVHVQDVYRPGGLLTVNQPPVPSLPANNNNYNPNQHVQYVSPPIPPPVPPPAVPLVPSPIPSTIPKAPVNKTPPQPVVSNIADDLLSLALEQQINASTINTEPNSPEPQSPISVDEDHQAKTNGKPIACIQPLTVVSEEKPIVQPVVTPVANLSSPQDPYDDKDKLDQLVSDVQRFEKHVSTMTKKTLNGTIPLEVEWKVRYESVQKTFFFHLHT